MNSMIKRFILSFVSAVTMVAGSFGLVGSILLWDSEKFGVYVDFLYGIGMNSFLLFFVSFLLIVIGWLLSKYINRNDVSRQLSEKN
ncbi:MAG: hypothetical protein ACSHX7_14240 [Luteolibacter sp.]